MYKYWKRLLGLGKEQGYLRNVVTPITHNCTITLRMEEDTELQLISPLNIGQSSGVADMSRASSSSCQWFILVWQRLKDCIRN